MRSEPTLTLSTGALLGGGGEGVRLVVFAGATPTAHELPSAGAVVVGRGVDPDVPVEDRSLSRRHARIMVDDQKITLEDLGSRNGSRVRGQRVAVGDVVEIPPGEVFHLGNIACVVERATPERKAAPEVSRTSARARLDALVKLVAPSDMSVLLNGETGAGKEVAARAIHAASKRRDGPFVALNCAALPENLLESELFGYERGAFSGADRAKPGLFESAEGGTVFLDEIADMPAPVQAKLLRVIEDRQAQRLGALRPRPIDVRFVSASHRSLDDEVDAGRFREDLYFRLNGITLVVPPLRERLDELPALVDKFVREQAEKLGRAPPKVTTAALAALTAHSWPGNVRELKNVVERAVVLAGGADVVDAQHVRLDGKARARKADAPPSPSPSSSERDRILDALKQAAGNQTRAAELLGISRRTLINRIIELDIPRPRKA